MALFRKLIVILVAACVVESAFIKHIRRNQIVMSSTTSRESKHVAEGGAIVNLTFDSIDMSNEANRTLKSVPFMNFERFQIMNSTSAMDSSILNKTDWDCAESSPNFILSAMGEYASSSIFHTDEDALTAADLSKYMDLISFTVKPLRANSEFAEVAITAWQIDGKHPQNFDQLYASWGLNEDTGAFDPFYIEPRSYFEGWGEKVNWIEMSAFIVDEEENLVPWPFCLDNFLFEVREKGDDE